MIAPVQLGVCGDGSRASSEGCDDGNVDNGDGCDSSCSIESGFICPTNYIRATSVCVQPQIALVEFDASSLALSASEGDTVAHFSLWHKGNRIRVSRPNMCRPHLASGRNTVRLFLRRSVSRGIPRRVGMRRPSKLRRWEMHR